MNRVKSDLGTNNGEVTELLRDLLITTLSTAGVKQEPIREIVRCDMNVVNRITKHIRKARKNAD
jgi:hypothetical protein